MVVIYISLIQMGLLMFRYGLYLLWNLNRVSVRVLYIYIYILYITFRGGMANMILEGKSTWGSCISFGSTRSIIGIIMYNGAGAWGG